MITDELKAKYVFGQLTLREVAELVRANLRGVAVEHPEVLVRIEKIEVTYDEQTRDYTNYYLDDDSLFIFHDDDCKRLAFILYLDRKVKIKDNTIYIRLKNDDEDAKIRFFSKSLIEFDFE